MNSVEKSLLAVLESEDYSVSVRGAEALAFPPGCRLERHSHPEIEIDYISGSCCVMGLGEEYVPLRPGDCMVLFPGVPHLFFVDVRQDCRVLQLILTLKAPPVPADKLRFLKEALSCGNGARYARLSGCEPVSGLLEQILRYESDPLGGAYAQTARELCFAQLYAELSGRMEEAAARHSPEDKASRVVRRIHETLFSSLDIEELCADCGVSSRYVRRIFLERFGMNSSQYINLLRIGRAKELLGGCSGTAADAAEAAGFTSSQYFSRVFREYTGVSPLDYQRLCARKEK